MSGAELSLQTQLLHTYLGPISVELTVQHGGGLGEESECCNLIYIYVLKCVNEAGGFCRAAGETIWGPHSPTAFSRAPFAAHCLCAG